MQMPSTSGKLVLPALLFSLNLAARTSAIAEVVRHGQELLTALEGGTADIMVQNSLMVSGSIQISGNTFTSLVVLPPDFVLAFERHFFLCHYPTPEFNSILSWLEQFTLLPLFPLHNTGQKCPAEEKGYCIDNAVAECVLCISLGTVCMAWVDPPWSHSWKHTGVTFV
jgi:hypothetical protein